MHCVTYFTFALDINECLSDPCHDNAHCINSDGTYDCLCRAGYTGDGFNCTGTFLKSSKTRMQHGIFVHYISFDNHLRGEY